MGTGRVRKVFGAVVIAIVGFATSAWGQTSGIGGALPQLAPAAAGRAGGSKAGAGGGGVGGASGANAAGAPAVEERAFVPLGDPQSTELSGLVGPDGKATLAFERVKASAATRVRARLLPFRAAGDQMARVGFANSGDADQLLVERELTLAPGERELTVELRTWAFPPVGEYEGRLVFLTEQANQLAYKVKLSAAKPHGDLAVEPAQVQVEIEPRFWGKQSSSPVSLRLYDRDGSNGVVGLRARPAGENKGPHGSLSLADHLEFAIDGHSAPELWGTGWSGSAPSKGAHGDKTNEDVPLTVTLRNLERGEYHLGLKFESPNSRPGTERQVALTATVRHPAWVAWIVLMLGGLVSYASTGLVANRRAALEVERTIAGLSRDWLAELPRLPAVVWLRATRRMCRDQVKGGRALLIPATEALAEPLRRAAALLPLLEDCQRALSALNPNTTPRMRVYRERRRLETIIRRLDLNELTESTVKEKQAVIAATPGPESAQACNERKIRLMASFRVEQFSEYLGDGRAKVDASYQAIRTESSEGLDQVETVLEVLVEQRDDAPRQRPRDAGDGRAKLAALYNEISNEDSDGLDRVEAVLEVLFDRRDDYLFGRRGASAEDIRGLIAALPDSGKLNDVDLGDFFRVADQQSWARLESQRNALVVKPPASPAQSPGPVSSAKALDAPEALMPFSLCLEVSGDPDLSKDFMLTSRVDCTWTFTLESKSRLRWLTGRQVVEAVTWTERSRGHEIVQFSPTAGVLRVSARVSFEGRPPIPVPDHFVKIERPRELSLRHGLETAQMLATGITILLALLTGLTSQYYPNATFGSFKDYLALFMWAVTLDAIKNVMRGVTATAPPPPAPVPPAPTTPAAPPPTGPTK